MQFWNCIRCEEVLQSYSSVFYKSNKFFSWLVYMQRLLNSLILLRERPVQRRKILSWVNTEFTFFRKPNLVYLQICKSQLWISGTTLAFQFNIFWSSSVLSLKVTALLLKDQEAKRMTVADSATDEGDNGKIAHQTQISVFSFQKTRNKGGNVHNYLATKLSTELQRSCNVVFIKYVHLKSAKTSDMCDHDRKAETIRVIAYFILHILPSVGNPWQDNVHCSLHSLLQPVSDHVWSRAVPLHFQGAGNHPAATSPKMGPCKMRSCSRTIQAANSRCRKLLRLEPGKGPDLGKRAVGGRFAFASRTRYAAAWWGTSLRGTSRAHLVCCSAGDSLNRTRSYCGMLLSRRYASAALQLPATTDASASFYILLSKTHPELTAFTFITIRRFYKLGVVCCEILNPLWWVLIFIPRGECPTFCFGFFPFFSQASAKHLKYKVGCYTALNNFKLPSFLLLPHFYLDVRALQRRHENVWWQGYFCTAIIVQLWIIESERSRHNSVHRAGELSQAKYKADKSKMFSSRLIAHLSPILGRVRLLPAISKRTASRGHQQWVYWAAEPLPKKNKVKVNKSALMQVIVLFWCHVSIRHGRQGC